MWKDVYRNQSRQKTSNYMQLLDIIFQEVYDVVAGGRITERLHLPQVSCKAICEADKVTKEGWAKMLPIYLAMLEGDEEKNII